MSKILNRKIAMKKVQQSVKKIKKNFDPLRLKALL